MVVPSPADSCTKHRPPALRRNSTRPAMPTTSSVSWPASSLPSKSARTCSMVWVTPTSTGYGLMPSLIIIARLATRICTCSGCASGPNSLLPGSTASSSVAPSSTRAAMAASCAISISARSMVVIAGATASSSFDFSTFSVMSHISVQCTETPIHAVRHAGCICPRFRCIIFCVAKRAVAQLGSALRSGRRGRGFKSRQPDNSKGITGYSDSLFP